MVEKFDSTNIGILSKYRAATPKEKEKKTARTCGLCMESGHDRRK